MLLALARTHEKSDEVPVEIPRGFLLPFWALCNRILARSISSRDLPSFGILERRIPETPKPLTSEHDTWLENLKFRVLGFRV